MNSKVSIESVQTMIRELQTEVESRRRTMESDLAVKVNKAEDDSFKALDEVSALNLKVSNLGECMRLESDDKSRAIKLSFESEMRGLNTIVSDLQKNNDYLENEKTDRKEFEEMREKLKVELEPKVDLQEV
jgi:hypothetical protein